jgi:hypothetical protein
MKRTPDSVSKNRQKLAAEIKIWRAGIAAARRGLALDEVAREAMAQRVAFAEAQLVRCKKEMIDLNRGAKKAFWPRTH